MLLLLNFLFYSVDGVIMKVRYQRVFRNFGSKKGPWSHKGPSKMLLLLNFLFYSVDGVIMKVRYQRVFRKFGSKKGPIGPNFVKSYKMLLLLQFLFYSVDGVS